MGIKDHGLVPKRPSPQSNTANIDKAMRADRRRVTIPSNSIEDSVFLRTVHNAKPDDVRAAGNLICRIAYYRPSTMLWTDLAKEVLDVLGIVNDG